MNWQRLFQRRPDRVEIDEIMSFYKEAVGIVVDKCYTANNEAIKAECYWCVLKTALWVHESAATSCIAEPPIECRPIPLSSVLRELKGAKDYASINRVMDRRFNQLMLYFRDWFKEPGDGVPPFDASALLVLQNFETIFKHMYATDDLGLARF